MSKQIFLIGYDIIDNKRRVKLGRFLAKKGIRIEYLIFYVKAYKNEMVEIVMKINDIIDTEMDDVRIYEIENYGIALGRADLLDEMFIIK